MATEYNPGGPSQRPDMRLSERLIVKPEVADAIVFAGISIVEPGSLTITASDPPK